MASSEEKRAQRMARFDETVAGIDDRTGQRQDPTRAGGRRKLDVSEETVERLSRSKTPLTAAMEAQERMTRAGGWSSERGRLRGRLPGASLPPIWGPRDHVPVTLDLDDPRYSNKLERLGYALESRATSVPLPKHQRTIGSAHQFDWFDRAEPFERYEITREAARQADALNYTSDPAAYNRMKRLRDEMLAVDPRSDAEMREKGAKTRQELDRRAAFNRAYPPSTTAVRSNKLMSGVKTAGRVMSRLAWPLAAAGAITAVADEAEGSSLMNKANAAVRGGFGLDVINANRVLGRRLGLINPDDNTI